METTDGVYVCKNCDWVGHTPKEKAWSDPGGAWTGPHGEEKYSPPSSGVILKCPLCDTMVRTEEGWEKADRDEKIFNKVIFPLLLGSMFVGLILLWLST